VVVLFPMAAATDAKATAPSTSTSTRSPARIRSGGAFFVACGNAHSAQLNRKGKLALRSTLLLRGTDANEAPLEQFQTGLQVSAHRRCALDVILLIRLSSGDTNSRR
jgi:hypothetical protein